ncbi:lipoprotein-releasing ABC transporter ATP-binding protein LolD [uncultured Pseudoteredinibacter sp.]|uniref:lipoprotein-releasing ABC transporter ATP-binding protein LolD n=1 Tax=uncultured Pseudoteredinibacter sp. TaxID=1641701 RepID=UPI00262D6CE6|nr:lipoprotein-releasing ABC transporter ATP-binding protein LolD [uncultured Pseudoteredinibacter sp.]
MMSAVLECVNLSKSYDEGPEPVHVLEEVNFSLQSAERVAIVGASGSGKSTLLNLLGGLDQPSSGSVTLSAQAFSSLSPNERGKMRNRHMGFVYQFHHLLPEFSALENVAMPLMIGGQSFSEAKDSASQMLAKVGLAERLSHRPSALSGGERQRVAIARALVNKPDCVLMDEPTGNLDADTAAEIELLIGDLNQQLGISFILVTHDQALALRMDRVLMLSKRKLQQVESL